MTETRLCDACGLPAGKTESGLSFTRSTGEFAGAPLCRGCFSRVCGDLDSDTRSRRAQPKAELEARGENGEVLRIGDRVEYEVAGRVSRGVITAIHQPAKPDHAGRPVYDLTVNYDGSGEADAISGAFTKSPNATPPSPSAVEPKPNPLRGLAEAPKQCICCPAPATCGPCCFYCQYRLNTLERVRDGAAIECRSEFAALRKMPDPEPLIEPGRAPWDWCPDPDAPDGCG